MHTPALHRLSRRDCGPCPEVPPQLALPLPECRAKDPRQFIPENRGPISAKVSSYSARVAAITAICARRRATTASAQRAVLAGQKIADTITDTITEVSKITVTESGVVRRSGVADVFERSH